MKPEDHQETEDRSRQDSEAGASSDQTPDEKGESVAEERDEFRKQLSGLLGLSGEEPDEALLESAKGIAERAKEMESLRAELSGLLGLSGEESDEALLESAKGIAERAKEMESLRAELAGLKEAAERKKKSDLIAQGLAEGKLTRDLAENWASHQDSAALESFLEHAPHLIPVSRAGIRERKRESGSLTETDRMMIRMFGFQEDEYLQAKDV